MPTITLDNVAPKDVADAHYADTTNPHDVTKAQVGLGSVNNTSDADKPISTATQAALDLKADLVAGFVPQSQLPSYVDDILEFANLAAFPVTGEVGKIYIAIDTGKQYRWTGSAYVAISNGFIASTNDVPEGTNLYFTVARALATLLTGFTAGADTVLAATDTILEAFQKIQGQINARITATQTVTLANKRITPRVVSVTVSATPTINTDNGDFFEITGQNTAITSFTSNLSGTPTNGQTLWIAITDNGTARAITWGASFEASGNIALPTTTVISTRLDVAFIWNTVTSKWRCVGVA